MGSFEPISSVGVEDARDVGAHAVSAMVGHGHGFGVTLALVVAGAQADWIHVAPIGFDLRMLKRIAVAFRSGGDEKTRAVATGDFEHVASGGGT
jgi:hypothetical protein